MGSMWIGTNRSHEFPILGQTKGFFASLFSHQRVHNLIGHNHGTVETLQPAFQFIISTYLAQKFIIFLVVIKTKNKNIGIQLGIKPSVFWQQRCNSVGEFGFQNCVNGLVWANRGCCQIKRFMRGYWFENIIMDHIYLFICFI